MISVAVIGTGYIGPIHLGALNRTPGISVNVVVDSNAERARQVAVAYNVPHSCSDYREVINDPKIDVIHNCTPNKYHYEITKAALLANKQVFSEKPLAMSIGEAEELVDISGRKNATACINFCYRYYPVVQEMAVRIRQGDAGAVRLVTGSYLQDWLSKETDWSWRLLPSESGAANVIADLGSHWFDLVQFTTGLDVRDVMADLATIIPVRKRPKQQVLAFQASAAEESDEVAVELDDYASVLFHLSNGAPGSFTTSQVCHGRKSDTEFQVYGSNCSFGWNHKRSNTLWIGHRDRPNEVLIEDPLQQHPSTSRFATLPAGHPLGYHDAVLNLIRDFYTKVDTGDNTAGDLPDFVAGYREMRIVEAILLSSRNREWASVP